MTTISDCLNKAVLLVEHCQQPRRELQALLCFCTGLSLADLYTWPDRELKPADIDAFESGLKRRINGEPLAYITGIKEFWSLDFEVRHGVLVPRPETELLVEECLRIASTMAKNSVGKILDLGTGSGAVAIAIASEMPDWQIIGVDQNQDCINTALANVKRHKLSNVDIFYSDWFSHIPLETFDIIVSNPPYIDPNAPELKGDGVRFEPLYALVAEDKGMADICCITEQAGDYLKPGGYLLFEHGFDQAEATRAVLDKQGFIDAKSLKDFADLDRVSLAKKRH